MTRTLILERHLATQLWEAALEASQHRLAGFVAWNAATEQLGPVLHSHPIPDTQEWHVPASEAQHHNTCFFQVFTTHTPEPPPHLFDHHPVVLALDLQEKGVLNMLGFVMTQAGTPERTEVVLAR